MDEKRKAPRKEVTDVVEFYNPDASMLLGVGRLMNLSETGALVESRLRMEPGQFLMIHLRQQGRSGEEVPITIVHVRGKGAELTYSLKFNRPGD